MLLIIMSAPPNYIEMISAFAGSLTPEHIVGLLFSLAPALALLVLSQLVAEAALWVIVHVLKPLTAKTQTTLDDYVIDALPAPVRLGGFGLGLWLFSSTIWPGGQFLEHDWNFWLGVLGLAFFGFLAGKLANALVAWYYHELSAHVAGRHGADSLKISKESFPMFQRIVRYAAYIVTLILILNSFGVEITPLLTGLGIAGLAVAMALNDTLSNFFSGLHILTDKPIRNGDFISLDSEAGVLKGFVEEIGWRSTRIRTRGNCTYIIPNNKIATSVVVNFSRGAEDNWKGSSLSVGVDYSSDPQRVKKVMVDAIKHLQGTDKRLGSQEPVARLEEFADSAMVFRALWTVRNFHESEAVAAEVREAIYYAFQKEGISIPFPVRELRFAGGARKKILRRR